MEGEYPPHRFALKPAGERGGVQFDETVTDLLRIDTSHRTQKELAACSSHLEMHMFLLVTIDLSLSQGSSRSPKWGGKANERGQKGLLLLQKTGERYSVFGVPPSR